MLLSVPVVESEKKASPIPDDLLADISKSRRDISLQFYLQQLVDEKWNNDNLFASCFKLEWEESIALRCLLEEEAMYPSILEDVKEGRLTFVTEQEGLFDYSLSDYSIPKFS